MKHHVHCHFSGMHPAVLWLHYENDPPSFLKKMMEKGHVCARRTNNPGATLLHMHSWLTSRNPASRVPYLAHLELPIHLGQTDNDSKNLNKFPRFCLLSTLSSTPALDSRRFPVPSASQTLLDLANYRAHEGYHFIWIDLESVHTLAGVVGSIIDQCRKYDPGIVPSVLPADVHSAESTQSVFKLAAERVVRALRRGRYFLAFDGIETFAWPATTHHGLSHMALRRAKSLPSELCEFLNHLKAIEGTQGLGQSLVAISVDASKARHGDRHLTAQLAIEGQIRSLKCNPINPPGVRIRFDRVFAPSEGVARRYPLVYLNNPSEALMQSLMTATNQAHRKHCAGLIAIILFALSCFRRTRPLASLRQLLAPFLPTGQVDSVLARLTDPISDVPKLHILRQLEGGGFWFNRTMRDYVYEQNTRYTAAGPVRKCLQEAFDFQNCRNAVFHLFLCATTHQQIARTWYTRTFVQSQDTFAFFEYTYHRLSSVRSLTKLIAIARVAMQKQDNPQFARAILRGIVRCGQLTNSVANPEQMREQLDFADRDGHCLLKLLRETPATVQAIKVEPLVVLGIVQDELKQRHRRELRSLLRAWARSEEILRAQVPAEQLLHWCGELLEDDLKYRCNRVVVKYSGTAPDYTAVCHNFVPLSETCPSQAEFVDPAAEDDINKLREYLMDLQVKLWIERGDYDRCMAQRWRQLCGMSRPPKDVRDKVLMESLGSVLHCHQVLDIASCHLQLGQETTSHDEALKNYCEISLDLLKHVALRLSRGAFRQDGSLHEAKLRLLHLKAECQLARLSVFSHDNGFTGNPLNWRSSAAAFDEADTTVKEGLTEIRTQDLRTGQQPRSVIIDPTKDGALYLQYRAVFHLLAGRLAWVRPGKADVDPGTSDVERAFEQAFWNFDMARGGLGDHNALLSALIELYSAEACLARARTSLYTATSAAGFYVAMSLARAKYDSARGALQRAREALLATRRNAVWWKFFFQLVSQYHADRLLLGYMKLLRKRDEVLRFIRNAKGPANALKREEGTHGTEGAVRIWCATLQEFLMRLRRAYDGIRSAHDLYLPEAPGQPPAPRQWLRRIWWELTLCGFATGLLAWEVLSPNKSESDATKYILWQLEWLNESAGLNGLEGASLNPEAFPWREFQQEVLGNKRSRDRWIALIGYAQKQSVK